MCNATWWCCVRISPWALFLFTVIEVTLFFKEHVASTNAHFARDSSSRRLSDVHSLRQKSTLCSLRTHVCSWNLCAFSINSWNLLINKKWACKLPHSKRKQLIVNNSISEFHVPLNFVELWKLNNHMQVHFMNTHTKYLLSGAIREALGRYSWDQNIIQLIDWNLVNEIKLSLHCIH